MLRSSAWPLWFFRIGTKFSGERPQASHAAEQDCGFTKLRSGDRIQDEGNGRQPRQPLRPGDAVRFLLR